VILLLPGFGAAGYFLLEVLPELTKTRTARKAKSGIIDAVAPERRYRALREELDIADTIGNRIALAQECLTLGKFTEALGIFDGVISLPHGDEPTYWLGKATAEFALERPQDALHTLDELQRQWPNYNAPESHLLYARALEADGRLDEAVVEYETLSRTYAGAEPRVRQAMLLDKLNRKAEAKTMAEDVVKRFQRSPRFARKQQAEWLALAKNYLKG